MKRLILLLCLLALCLPAACGGRTEASPGADAPGGASPEERTFVLDGFTLVLPEVVRDPRWSGPEKGVVQAEFTWNGDAYVYRAKKTGRLENLSGMRFTDPEGGELPENAARCVVDGSEGFIAWYARGHSFSLSMEEKASSDKLQLLYNLLRKDRFLSDFTQPPELWVLCGGRDVPAARTTYSWTRRNNLGEGGRSLVFADGMHPLQMLDDEGRINLTPLKVPAGAVVVLDFELTPDELTLRCWPEETARAIFEDPDLFSAYVEQPVELTVTDGRFAPPGPGNYIYEVVAKWSDDSGYGGTAYYGFYSTGSQAE